MNYNTKFLEQVSVFACPMCKGSETNSEREARKRWYATGVAARRSGIEMKANPYQNGSHPFIHWRNGWMAGAK